MGIAAIDLMTVDKFVSSYDEGFNAIVKNQAEIDATKKGDTAPEPVYAHADTATRWHVGAIDSVCMGILADDTTRIIDGELRLRPAESDILAARLALRGWDNFETPFETGEIKIAGFKYEGLTEAAAKTIPLVVLREIGRHAKATNQVSAATAKN